MYRPRISVCWDRRHEAGWHMRERESVECPRASPRRMVLFFRSASGRKAKGIPRGAKPARPVSGLLSGGRGKPEEGGGKAALVRQWGELGVDSPIKAREGMCAEGGSLNS